ncbi:MAG: putative lipid II flippase FtsW [Nitrospirae bacterium CG_4_10_14_0_8_um_filter_41_23]|nr:putative lipid II flippase FtsW [Nitrospirota bacterium]OIP58810.1 MAG: putative lipid II flippase FtsW [Nitrospirae bacterium CG2_30_41_42]PIQ95089.1 MAG: putative lipid II flippase FtsW [Nitrospirae bacterium CG11_big_fil_rev_8_21_14_0_20_41_14]PIV41649.1 MAG: putative lipid II flippase FtsW [Nitrospirae bacterium CG02_land_8_20_14_3_00_41_53]PIW86697.1 MAG: putative lipid II flippase FtsW [Nitrospirae bacterium CG_4_8_14_3_um_filter_41_47]PIY86266.1 MAG: putative lipid II flippase FtsW [
MGKYDRWLLLVAILLIGFGALMIYSTTSVITPVLAKRGVTEFYYFKRHVFTILIGFSFMFLAYRLKTSTIKKMAIPLLIFSFVLLILVFLPNIGVSAGGARRWIKLWPSTFQPSELVKLSMVIFLARYISMPGYRTDSFISFIKPIFIVIIFQIAILKQPDFGAAMSLAFLTFAMLFLSGIRLRYIASLLVFVMPVIFKLITEPYRLKRLTSFLDPWKDAQGSGFQLVQSFIALGSGGLTGVGLGCSKQKLSYLPESHTDFIFSIIGEEFGFIGVLVVITLFLLLFIKGISIANRAKDGFVYYLAIGLSLMISLQALINFAVATGLVPTKGLPLPFVSYGGSALLVNLAAIGILLNISRGEHNPPSPPFSKGGMGGLSDEMHVRRRARRNMGIHISQ